MKTSATQGNMSQSHYSLRWNNHQSHILQAFDALLQAETLVDVTLVCAESSVRAHKVVLSACSPFFQRIFAENPCKHPVIVLKDFSGWEVQAIVDFMYKGEISVIQDQLQNLIKAAESLQVRGLANQEHFNSIESEKELLTHPNTVGTPASSTSPADFDHQRAGFYRFHSLPLSAAPSCPTTSPVTFSTCPKDERPESPLPRRKQARPRRRSGEMLTPQDLTCQKTSTPDLEMPAMEKVENLSMKKPRLDPVLGSTKVQSSKDKENQRHPPQHLDDRDRDKKKLTFQGQFIHSQHLLPSQMQRDDEERSKILTPDPSGSPELDLSIHHHKEFPPSPPLLPPMMSLKHDLDGHSPLPFPPLPVSVSSLTMTPPHSKFFGLDSPLLFPPGLDGCRNPLLELADPRTTPESQMFTKKKMGRPKGQHSAPRGGPPRSWTNAELTEALQHVWNKKMTTSQASRIFGIPYNSLLMYVRGKYGKSLKLEQLRKDCIGGPGGVDLMNLAGGMGATGTNNNNNSLKNTSSEDLQRPSSADEHPSHLQQPHQPQQAHSVFNPFAHNFYPDFATAGFPIPVSMIHLLPQSEKNRENFPSPCSGGGGGMMSNDLVDECMKNERSVKDEPQEHPFVSPSLSREDRREFVHQNGQD